MRDDRNKWASFSASKRAFIKNSNVQISVVQFQRQTLVSGAYTKCLNICDLSKATGWPQISIGKKYAVRLRRDRILVVNGPTLEDGWQPEFGVSVSDMSSAYVVIDIKGRNAFDFLNHGSDLNLDIASGSVMRMFQGFPVLIYQRESEGHFRLHVSPANLDAIWQVMQTFTKQITANDG